MTEKQPTVVSITLGHDVQEDWESYQECIRSLLNEEPNINKFLYYIGNYGTYRYPIEPT